jgi:3'-phosphoadenosine 5'-phosphosulfate sulfotransferase (PAPS reductase)/FAD synthetase
MFVEVVDMIVVCPHPVFELFRNPAIYPESIGASSTILLHLIQLLFD